MKKKWIIIAVVVLVLIVGGLVGYLIGQKGSNQVPGPFVDASGIDWSPAKMPPEVNRGEITVKVELDKTALSLGRFEFVAKITNNSHSILGSAEFTYRVYCEDGTEKKDTISFYNLEFGKTQTLYSRTGGMYGKKIARVTYVLQNLVWEGTVVSPPGQTDEPKTVEKPEKQPAEGNVYYAAPKNPQTAADVTVAFYFYLNDEEYLKAARLIEQIEPFVESGKMSEAEARNEFKNKMSDIQPETLDRIEIAYVNEDAETGKASVGFTLYFKDGKEKMYTSPSLIKENGKWKIALSNF